MSDKGRVKSLRKIRLGPLGRIRHYPEKMLRCGVNARGYPTVGLYRDQKVKMRKVHTLVLEAFVGPRPEGMEGLHFDDIKANNQLGNLRWGTTAENSFDAVRNGVHNKTRRDRCSNGHYYTDKNTRWTEHKPGRWSRQCRACGREYQQKLRDAPLLISRQPTPQEIPNE